MFRRAGCKYGLENVSYCVQDPILLTWINFDSSMISYEIHYKVRDEITLHRWSLGMFQ